MRKAIRKFVRVLVSSSGFNTAIDGMRLISSLDYRARREAEKRLPPEGGAKNLGWGDHIDAIDYWCLEAFRNGAWASDYRQSEQFTKCYSQAVATLVRLDEYLRRYGLREQEVIYGAIFTDYRGTEFELWIDYLVAHTKVIEYFWISSEEFESLPPQLRFKMKRDTEYVAVTGLNEVGLQELIEELRRRLVERREEEKLIAMRIDQGNPFARELPSALRPPSKPKRGSLPGATRGSRLTPGIDWSFDDLVESSPSEIDLRRQDWVNNEINRQPHLPHAEVRRDALNSFKQRLYAARKRARGSSSN